MNLDVYTHGFLQDFVSLYKSMHKHNITIDNIEERIPDIILNRNTTSRARPALPTKKEREQKKSDINSVQLIPALSECCHKQLFMIGATCAQRKRGTKFRFVCGECDKEFIV